MAPPLSAEQRKILERQRRLAAQMRSSGSSSNSNNNSNVNKPAVAPAAASNRKRKLPSTARKPPPPPPPKSSTASSTTSTIKRATKRRSVPSVAATVAHARKMAAAQRDTPTTNTTTNTNNTTANNTTLKKPSPQLQRKTKNPDESSTNNSTNASKKAPGSLAKLLQNAPKTTHSNNNTAPLKNIFPDDFWKHLREWDFLGQLARTALQHNSGGGSGNNNNNPKANDDIDDDLPPPPKAIPNTFVSARHYVAAWAPLCLAECRAQLLQEFTTAQRNNGSIPVMCYAVAAPHSGGGGRHRNNNSSAVVWDASQEFSSDTGGYLRLEHASNNNSGNNNRRGGRKQKFFPNDLVVLVTEPSLIADVQRRRNNNNNNAQHWDAHSAVVGHVEHMRQSVDGLLIKISRRKWARVVNNDGGNSNRKGTRMHLFCLGSNITALREFTALCQVEQLPVQRYLLGHHLTTTDATSKTTSSKLKKPKPSADQLLAQLGGVAALGHGFMDYCRKKFNASQLTAIAASAEEYGHGGLTLIKGPPGTGKTTTLVAILNSLHTRQYNKYYEMVRTIATKPTGARQTALDLARRAKPRLLVCAPSNAAVDNIILKIMEDGFVDGRGQRYNPSMIRIGVGQSSSVANAVGLEQKIDDILQSHLRDVDAPDGGQLESSLAGYRTELTRISQDIAKLRRRVLALSEASPWPLSRDWEIRIDEEQAGDVGFRVYFCNHKTQTTTYEPPPPPEPGEKQFHATSMPEYRNYLARIVKLVENFFSVKTELERCSIIKTSIDNGSHKIELRQNLETHLLNNSVHMVMTTLGTAGSRILSAADRFEVVVVDEAAQSVEPATLAAFSLGSRHAVLVGDPQQLPATIFNVSGRHSKYDRSLFQRLEEAGQPVYMLNEQYRMHPKISHFPRHIFYGGNLKDGPNVRKVEYGNPLLGSVRQKLSRFSPFMILDLDSKEERGGTSLSNSAEAQLAVYLYMRLSLVTNGLSKKTKVAVITPYAQQARLLREFFLDTLGEADFDRHIEVHTVDAYQGREANIVIFSAVRAAGSHGIGFLSDIRRMNVALTRAKHFLFVIARCESVVVNPYWNDLVNHARDTQAVLKVPMFGRGRALSFGELREWELVNGQLQNPRIGSAHTEPEPSRRTDPRKPPPNEKNDVAAQASNTPPSFAPKIDPRSKPAPATVDPRKPQSQETGPTNVSNTRPLDPRKASRTPPDGGATKSDPRKKNIANSTKPRMDPRKRS